MHVLQYISVEADNKDLAYMKVKENLEGYMGPSASFVSWFDWFVVGGGRWNVKEGDDFREAYAEGKTNLIISYDEDPVDFRTKILRALEDRKAEFDSYAKDVDTSVLDKIITEYNPKEFDFSLFQSFYPIKKIIDMAYGEWDFNSYFYDMTTESTSPNSLYDSIDKGNKNWYLVPVDFHF
jgi:hypothetical protein